MTSQTGTRIGANVRRPPFIDIIVDGATVQACEGESLATALMASGRLTMSRDLSGRPRSPFCNMGVCFDCMVLIEDEQTVDAAPVRARACMTPVRAGLRISTVK